MKAHCCNCNLVVNHFSCIIYVYKTAKWKISILVGVLQIALDIIAVHTIDNMMESVTLSDTAKVVMVLILFCIDKMLPSSRKKGVN
ncbi:YrvL family regulatory protein [Paenibacillus sp. MZ04-78.2]|uniref:YrvL family regulatory protein n=1 Tax=Paenibacillus sp. MZ04-78.2 TaxID=2962034 RepID=UPI0035CA0980